MYGRQAWGLHQWDIGNIGEAYRYFMANDPAVLHGAVSSHSETPVRRDVSGEWPGWRAVVTALRGDAGTAGTMIDEWNGPADPLGVATWAYYITIIASMAGDAGWVIRTIERWMAMGTGRTAVQQEHYVRLNWYWARALTGDDPAGIAAEAEQLLATTLVDPPRWGIAYHNGLLAEMWLAAGGRSRPAPPSTGRTGRSRPTASATPKDSSACCGRACSRPGASPSTSSGPPPKRPEPGPPIARPTSSPAGPRSSWPPSTDRVPPL